MSVGEMQTRQEFRLCRLHGVFIVEVSQDRMAVA